MEGEDAPDLIPSVHFVCTTKGTTWFDTTGRFGWVEARLFFFFHLLAEVRRIISKRQLSCARECSASFPSLHNKEDCSAVWGYSGGGLELLVLGLGSCPCSAGTVLQLLPHSCALSLSLAGLHLQVEMLLPRAVICLNAPQLYWAQCTYQH